MINGLARDSDGSDLFIGGRFSRVNSTCRPLQLGTSDALAKVDEAAGTADPNWIAPLLGSTDLTTLMVFGSRVYVGRHRPCQPDGDPWPVASFSTVNNNASLNINWHPMPAGGVESLAAAGSTVYIGSGAIIDGLPHPRSSQSTPRLPVHGDTGFAPALGRGRKRCPRASRRASGRSPSTARTSSPAGRSRTRAGLIAATSPQWT